MYLHRYYFFSSYLYWMVLHDYIICNWLTIHCSKYNNNVSINLLSILYSIHFLRQRLKAKCCDRLLCFVNLILGIFSRKLWIHKMLVSFNSNNGFDIHRKIDIHASRIFHRPQHWTKCFLKWEKFIVKSQNLRDYIYVGIISILGRSRC